MMRMCTRASRDSPLLGQRVELGNGVVEGLLGEVARAVGRVQDLVVEDREVEGQAEADRVRGRQLRDGDVRGSLVGLERLVGGVLALVARGELGEVAVVVTLPVGGAITVSSCVRQPEARASRTSCGRTPCSRPRRPRGSGACPERQGCPRRSGPAQPRSSRL